MWSFPLTLLIGILFISDIHPQAWQCYDLLEQCINDSDGFLDISKINSSNINYFCENYTQSFIPCLANGMNEKPGVTYRERFLILRKCIENDRSGQNNLENTTNMIKILRLYLYSCIYNSMVDMSQSSCFNKLVQNCVEKNPTAQKCYYWSCKSEDFLTLRRSNVLLPKVAEENDDIKKFIESIDDNKTGKWKRMEIAEKSIVQNGNYQIMERKFAIYLAIYLYLIHSFDIELMN